jgi:hypothetical protein
LDPSADLAEFGGRFEDGDANAVVGDRDCCGEATNAGSADADVEGSRW